MMAALRRFVSSWIAKALFWLLIVVFCFWGIGTGMFSQVHPVAQVNGVRILADQVQREADQMRQYYQRMLGANAPVYLKHVNLQQEALERIIENQLVDDQARRLGLEVGRKALEEKIASQRGFQRNGQFDFQLYRAVLRDNDLLPTEYETSMRSQMVHDALRQMIDQGVQVSDDEARHQYDLDNQNITLRYLEVPYSEYTARITPTQQEVAAFYEKNKELFREPERVKIALIHYDPQVLAAKTSPSAAEINDFYQRNLKSRFTHPELASASHILIAVPDGAGAKTKAAARGKAEEIIKKLKAGANFAKLAKKYSDDPGTRDSGGALGFFPRGQMVKPFNDAVFSMKPGEIRLVETTYGYHVVKLDQLKPAHTDTLVEARPKIIEELREQVGSRLARQAVDEDLEAAVSGTSFQEIAKKRGLEVISPAAFARGEPIPEIGTDREIADNAFTQGVGSVRAVPEKTGAYLMKVVKRFPSYIPPLADIQSKVRDAYIRATAERRAGEQARKLLAQIKTPSDFDRVAAANHLTPNTTDPFKVSTRSVPGIGSFPEVTEAAALVASVPTVIDHVMDRDGNSYLFEVTSRVLPTEEQWNSAKTSFTQQFLARRRALAWDNYMDQLKSDAKIQIYSEQLGQPPTEQPM
jgi:peptidyl-prolyl cis-trans isomerase D